MTIFQAAVYGVVQGLTEFLPISSSAHLRIVPELFGWPDAGSAFTAVIQLGTIAAVILYFRRDLAAALRGWTRSLATRDFAPLEARIGWGVFIGTIPIVLLGLLFKHQIEGPLRSLWVIAFTLIGMGGAMLLAERYGNKARTENSVTIKDGLVIGVWQALALIPGMSRSGSTISGALFANFDRPTAARFSFLLSVPSITAAGLYEAYKERHGFAGGGLITTLFATLISFAVGYAAISWLIPFIARKGIRPFVMYRVAIGVVLIALLSLGRIAPSRAPEVVPSYGVSQAP